MNNLQNKDPLNQSYQTSIPSEVSLVTVPHDDSMANFLQNNSEVDPFFVDNSKESITFNLTKFNDFLDKIKISKIYPDNFINISRNYNRFIESMDHDIKASVEIQKIISEIQKKFSEIADPIDRESGIENDYLLPHQKKELTPISEVSSSVTESPAMTPRAEFTPRGSRFMDELNQARIRIQELETEKNQAIQKTQSLEINIAYLEDQNKGINKVIEFRDKALLSQEKRLLDQEKQIAELTSKNESLTNKFELTIRDIENQKLAVTQALNSTREIQAQKLALELQIKDLQKNLIEAEEKNKLLFTSFEKLFEENTQLQLTKNELEFQIRDLTEIITTRPSPTQENIDLSKETSLENQKVNDDRFFDYSTDSILGRIEDDKTIETNKKQLQNSDLDQENQRSSETNSEIYVSSSEPKFTFSDLQLHEPFHQITDQQYQNLNAINQLHQSPDNPNDIKQGNRTTTPTLLATLGFPSNSPSPGPQILPFEELEQPSSSKTLKKISCLSGFLASKTPKKSPSQ
jgi:hypothetical protein